MEAKAALRIETISKAYGSHSALIDASLTLQPGEITAILGASGAGKTTLLRLIAGMETPQSGTISIGEKVLSSPSKIVRPESRQIGLIFQDFALFPHLDVAKNVSFGLSGRDREEAETLVDEWLTRLSLQHRRGAYPHQLSGGEQQRVAIARALAVNPVAILMDEPFSGLDPALREDIRGEALGAVRSANIPALLVTHDPAEALADADKIAVLSKGKIVQFGTPDTLYTDPVNQTVARALGPIVHLPKEDAPAEWASLQTDSPQLCFRPEAVQPVAKGGVSLRVLEARRVGGLSHIVLETGKTHFTTHMLLPHLPELGSDIRVDLSPDALFQYADHNSDISVR